MNQDRRITDKLPTEKLDWTDTGANLAAAALAHLEAGKAAACLVRAKDDVWVGVGSKDALRGLLSAGAASQSQAVPSELASLTDERITEIAHKAYLAKEMRWGGFKKDADGKYTVPDLQIIHCDLVRAVVKSLFSHSAATGKVPEGWKLVPTFPTPDMIEAATRYEPMSFSEISAIDPKKANAAGIYRAMLAASPAAPLAVKAAELIADLVKLWDSQTVSKDDYNEEMCRIEDAMRKYVSAPLAAAVPAEEASHKDVEWLVAAAELARTTSPEVATRIRENCKAAALREKLDAPAEPAPIQASAEVMRAGPSDESQAREWLASHGYSSLIYALTDLQSRIEAKDAELRDLVARLSEPTAQGAATGNEVIDKQVSVWRKEVARLQDMIATATGEYSAQGAAQSIDTPEFGEKLSLWFRAALEDEKDEGKEARHRRTALIADIDRYIAAQAPAGRDAVLEEAAKAAEQCFVSIGQPDDPHPDAVTFNGAVYDCARTIRALKSHAAEQTEGRAK